MAKVWDIFEKLWDIFENILDIFVENYGIYWAKTKGDFMGYIWQKYAIYWAKIIIYNLGYIGLKLLDKFRKTMGYTSPLDILMGYIKQKL